MKSTLLFGLAFLLAGLLMTRDGVQRAILGGPDPRPVYRVIWDSEGELLPAATLNAAGWVLAVVGAFLCLTRLGPWRR